MLNASDARALRLESDGADTLIGVKGVPGAKRPGVAGVLGDRLKVKVSAPAEGGKANAAICEAVAHAIGCAPSEVAVERGHSDPVKVLRVSSMMPDAVRSALTGDTP